MKTFVLQSKLPRLPIPKLETTLAKYMKSLEPFPRLMGNGKTEKVVKSFLSDPKQGPALQQRLIDYDKTQPNSWLEQIWYKKAYLEWPDPIMINVNWWLEFKDHQKYAEQQAVQLNSSLPFTTKQVDRATGLIANLLYFHRQLNNETYPIDFMGKNKTPLCMNQYKMLYGVCRVPGRTCDTIYHNFPSPSKHIVVLLQDQIYKVQVIGSNGEILGQDAIREQLKKVVDVHSTLENKQAPIGVLTTERRNVWADARGHLMTLSEQNKKNFKDIETALFAICLEDYQVPKDFDVSHRMSFHGKNGRNRWFDMAMSFIFDTDARGGCSGEHSPSDAVTPAGVFRQALMREPAEDVPEATNNVELEQPQLMKWSVDDRVQKFMDAAHLRADNDILDLDSVILHINDFGGNTIKSNVKCGPDAFVQMAMQLAYFRTYTEACPTYESASTRQFLHGRTATIRSCTSDSVAFTKAFDNPSTNDETKLKLMKIAIDTHTKNTIEASNGQDVDRHLLGLRCMLTPEEMKSGEVGAIFRDPAYFGSMSFKLSSSNVSPGDFFWGGFGPVMANGYGVNYAIGKESLKFSVSARRVSGETCARSFRRVIDESLRDMLQFATKHGGLKN